MCSDISCDDYKKGMLLADDVLKIIKIIKNFCDIINEVTSLLEGFGEIVSQSMLNSIIGTLCATVTLGFSIAVIVKTSISIHGGSKSEAANKIRKIVEGFITQLKSAEKLLHATK